MSNMKMEHKAAMRRQAKLHSAAMEKKKQQLKRADTFVVGMPEMFSEMLDEMMANRKETRKAGKEVEQSKQRAAVSIRLLVTFLMTQYMSLRVESTIN